jgi:hypothetical protein
MTRLEKAELLKSKGYTYNPETGKIYGVNKKELKRKTIKGYINLIYDLKGHHFAWYMVYGNVDFDELDHYNRVRDDNRITNLRISDRNQQNQNRSEVKGYNWHKLIKKWQAQIQVNGKKISLGYFNTEDEARNAYLEAKKIYHKNT